MSLTVLNLRFVYGVWQQWQLVPFSSVARRAVWSREAGRNQWSSMNTKSFRSWISFTGSASPVSHMVMTGALGTPATGGSSEEPEPLLADFWLTTVAAGR